jgi:hypothetical protein
MVILSLIGLSVIGLLVGAGAYYFIKNVSIKKES